jgi:hypothetical protein
MTYLRNIGIGMATAALLLLQACYYPTYATAPAPSKFDTAWQALHAAAVDEGVRITADDRGSGTIRGEKGTSSVLMTANTQADASVRVAISVTAPNGEDTGLKDRLTRSYQRHMGR